MLAVLIRALRQWRPYGKQGLLMILCLLVQQGFSTYVALSLKLILDTTLHGGSGAALARILIILCAGFGVSALATVLCDYLSAQVGAAIVNDLRRELFAHLQRLPLGFFTRTKSGDLVSRFVSDVADLEKGLVERLLDGVCALLGLLLNLPLLLFLEWRLALLAIVLLLLLPLTTRRLATLASLASYQRKGAESALASTVQEQVRVQPVIRAFGLGETMRSRFALELQSLGGRMAREGFLGSLVGTSSSLAVLLVQLIVIAAGSYLALRGQLSGGTLVAAVSLLANVTKDAYTLTKKVGPSLLKASGGLRRLDELLAERAEAADAPGALTLPRLHDELRFTNVGFSHGGGRPHLAEVSFSIRAGSRVALVGPSGCGKSTVLGLLLRFHDPDRGALFADGHDLRQVTRASLRAQLGVVLQDPMLLGATVRDTICLGRPEATDGEVEAAARAAEIHDAIVALPEGYAAPIGELGGRLSGGQRQRLAIARALLRNPAVLILDEPTAALDAATESLVLATLSRLGHGRTVICATHRLAFARDADQILVFDGGRIVEEGRHDELLERRGLYHRLWHAPDAATAES